MTSESHETQDASTPTEEEQSSASTPELIGKLPPEAQDVVQSVFAASWGPIPNPILEKITPQHIDQVITLHAQESDRVYKDASESRHHVTLLLVLSMISALAIILVLSLAGQRDVLFELVKIAAPFVGGGGLGYGISEFRHRND